MPPGAAAPPPVARSPDAPASAGSSAEFGVSNGPLQAKQQATKRKSMTAAVSSISTRAGGELAMTLDNGQVWVQIKSLPYFPLKAGDKVEIDVGAMGSYIMWVPSIRRATKVTRVY